MIWSGGRELVALVFLPLSIRSPVMTIEPPSVLLAPLGTNAHFSTEPTALWPPVPDSHGIVRTQATLGRAIGGLFPKVVSAVANERPRHVQGHHRCDKISPLTHRSQGR